MNDLSRSASPVLPAPITTEDYSFLIQSILPQPSSSSSSGFPNAIKSDQSYRGLNPSCTKKKGLTASTGSFGQSESSAIPPSSQSTTNARRVRHKVPFREALYAPSDDDSGCAVDEVTWSANEFQPQILRSMAGLNWKQLEREAMMMATMRQLPPQDFDENFCKSLNDAEKRELKLFDLKRKKENFGRGKVEIVTDRWNKGERDSIPGGGVTDECRHASPSAGTSVPANTDEGVICQKCGHGLAEGELSIKAERAGSELFWHPSCFVCSECQEVLVDWIYFHDEGRLFCGRHHAERLKPRCNACDEIIFADECTEAESKSWHVGHFICQSCHSQLGGRRYVILGDTPFCCPCFDRLAPEGQTCSACGMVIQYDEGHVICGSDRWHSNESCFKCSQCNRSLIEKIFYQQGDKLLCCHCLNQSADLHHETSAESNSQVDSQPQTLNRCDPCATTTAPVSSQNYFKPEPSVFGEPLISSIQSEVSLEEKLMLLSVLSSESENVWRDRHHPIGKAVLNCPGFTCKSTCGVDGPSSGLTTSVHSYARCSSAIFNNNNNDDDINTITTTNNNNNSSAYNYLNYLSSLSSVNLYERLRRVSGSERSSLGLYEAMLSEVETKSLTHGRDIGRCWLNAVRSGSWMISDGYGSELEKWLDKCGMEKPRRLIEETCKGDGKSFTFKILNRFPFSELNRCPGNGTSELKAAQEDDLQVDYSVIPELNSVKSTNTGPRDTVKPMKIKQFSAENSSGRIASKVNGDAKFKQPSKARKWNRVRTDGYSSDSGKKRNLRDGKTSGLVDSPFYAELEKVTEKFQQNRSRRLQAACRYYQRHNSMLSSEDDGDEDDESGQRKAPGSAINHNTYDKVFNGECGDDIDVRDDMSSSHSDGDDAVDELSGIHGFYHELNPVGNRQKDLIVEKISGRNLSKPKLKQKPKGSRNDLGKKSRDFEAKVYQNLKFTKDMDKYAALEKATVTRDFQITKNDMPLPSPPLTRQPRLGVAKMQVPGYHRSLLADLSPFRYRRRIEVGLNLELQSSPVDGNIWHDVYSKNRMGRSSGEKLSRSKGSLGSEVKVSNGDIDVRAEEFFSASHNCQRRHRRRHRHRHHRKLHHHWRDWYSTCDSSSSCSSDNELIASCTFLFTSSSSSSSEFDYYLDEPTSTCTNDRPSMASALPGNRAMTGSGSALTTCFSSLNRFKNRNKILYVTSERWEKNKDKIFYPKQCVIS